MGRELRASFSLYLMMKDGETYDEALDRMYDIIRQTEKENGGLCFSDMYDSEIQEL